MRDFISVLAIDPGTTQSGYVKLTEGGIVEAHEILDNESLLEKLERKRVTIPTIVVIEMIASQGMAVGKEVFETCVWIGRFIEAWKTRPGGEILCIPCLAPVRILRRDIKLAICGSARAKDGNIRQALIDRYGPGKEKAIGKKATPGPLYGIRSHEWAALALGVTYLDQNRPGWCNAHTS